MLYQFCRGIQDALSLRNSWVVIQGSPKIKNKLVKIWCLNLVLIFGSMLIFEIVSWLLSSIDHRIILALEYIYYTLLVYPTYLISLLLNGHWYNKISQEAFSMRSKEILKDNARQKPNATGNSLTRKLQKLDPLTRLSNDLYRLLLGIIYLIQTSLITRFPFIGQILFLISISWLYSLYSFEYVWAIFDFSQQDRLNYFSKRWLYFIGYGLPLALCTLFVKTLLRDVIFAIVFPLLIVNSFWAKPQVMDLNARLPSSFNPFALSQLWLSALVNRGLLDIYSIIVRLFHCCRRRPSKAATK